jgi:glycosyltransferase involved in cell wall biosynthesis
VVTNDSTAGVGTDRALDVTFVDSWHTDVAVGSGSAAGIRGLADGMRALGHRVQVLRPQGTRGPLIQRRLRFNAALRDRLRRLRHDLVVGFDIDGFLLPKARDHPFVVSLKGVLADEARFERGLQRFQLSALARLEQRNARRADRVFVTSEYSSRAAISAYGLDTARVRVVPEGIDTEFWRPGDAAPTGHPVVVSVARQYPRKNTRTLVEAIPIVLESVPNLECRIVGGGPELPTLRRRVRRLQIENHVRLLGALPRAEDVREEYRRASVFCLPSLQEGFGIAFLEAMATGLPIVAADSGAVPEVAPHGEFGLLVDGRSAPAVAVALVRLLEDESQRRRLARAGRERARRYAWPLVARAFLNAALERHEA